ncbi:MAG: potassium channel family protein [Acidimicrobiia bacterium]|nr:potassium channel family protein [Acidimicrobiia bacterium]
MSTAKHDAADHLDAESGRSTFDSLSATKIDAMTDGPSSAHSLLSDHAYKLLAGSAVVLLVVGTVMFRLLEDWSWVDSFYFSAIAVATVGFGDLTPTSDGSKLFTVMYIFAGIGLITTYFNARTRRQASRRVTRRQDRGETPTESDD